MTAQRSTMSAKKETAAQRKLREAQELVQQAKKAEQAAWREKWQQQQQDREYQRKQAERNANSEERSRKIAIGKENKQLAVQAALKAKLVKEGYRNDELVAIHEAGHAVVHEILGLGVHSATILPGPTAETANLSPDKIEVRSLGHVTPAGELAVSPDDAIIHKIAGLKAGGQATANAGYPYLDEDGYDTDEHGDDLDEDNGQQGGCGKDEEMVDEVVKKIKSINAWQAENLGHLQAIRVLDDPKAWAATLEIADGLLIDKTLSGADIRTIVKKHQHPELGIKIDIGRQLSFHYRKNRQHTYTDGIVPFTIGIGDYHYGYQLSQPAYVKATEDKAKDMKPVLFPAGFKTQLPLFTLVIGLNKEGKSETNWKPSNEGQVTKVKKKNSRIKTQAVAA